MNDKWTVELVHDEKMENAKKEILARELMKYDYSVIALALSYAIGMERYGIDITEKIDTATQQMDAMHRAEIRGYEKAMQQLTQNRD